MIKCLTNKTLQILLLISLLQSCGGNEGTICTYSFGVINKNELTVCINKLYNDNPKYVDTHFTCDTSEYKYCRLYFQSRQYVFCYRVIDSIKSNECFESYSDNWCTLLSLKTANTQGEILPFAKDLSNSERKKFAKIFNDSFINKLIVYLPESTKVCRGGGDWFFLDNLF